MPFVSYMLQYDEIVEDCTTIVWYERAVQSLTWLEPLKFQIEAFTLLKNSFKHFLTKGPIILANQICSIYHQL